MDGRVNRDQGFTLIELMIVVTVLALLATGATLAFNRPGSGTSDKARFIAVYEQLKSEAVLANEYRGLGLRNSGYVRLRRLNGRWLEHGQEVAWRGSVTLPNTPNLFFSPNGQVTPIQIGFDGSGSCNGSMLGELEC